MPDAAVEADIHALMTTITGLGDPAVTMSTAAVMLGVFLHRSRTAALHWLGAVAACGLVTCVAKLGFYAYGRPIPGLWLASPSGHVAASVLVYGALALIASDAPPLRALLGSLAAIAVGLIAVSRVYLDFHSDSDVVVGTAIGAACLAWFAPECARQRATRTVQAGALAAVAICVTGAAMGWRLHVDHALHVLASYMAGAN